MILFRDQGIVVVDKPSGLASHRGWSRDDDALLQRVRDDVGAWVYLIHRLDRGASGVVMFALDVQTARVLSENWSGVHKRYLAITRGHPPLHTVLDHAIPSAPGGDRVAATTELWCRETFGRYALVEASPRTGRLHQIRRHLKHIACPIIGDVKYGKGEHNRLFRAQHDLHRLALHAASMTFPLPRTGEPVTVTAPLPVDMVRAIESCRTVYG